MLCTTIIPTIGRDSLTKSVTSVVDQALDRNLHEVIVVNDSGCTLEQAEWLRSMSVAIVDVNRCGVGVACNVGAALACGKYMKILHDDDQLLPGGLEALVESAEASGGCCVVGGYELVDHDGALVATRTSDFPWQPFALFAVGENVHVSHALFRRQDYLDVGGFDPTMKICEDGDLMARLALQGGFANTDRIVARVRVAVGPGSAFRDVDHVMYWRRVREKILDQPKALPAIIRSAGSDPFMRGRVCRAYSFSAVLNLFAGRLWKAISRVSCATRVAVYYPLFAGFWKGASYRMRFDENGNLIS